MLVRTKRLAPASAREVEQSRRRFDIGAAKIVIAAPADMRRMKRGDMDQGIECAPVTPLRHIETISDDVDLQALDCRSSPMTSWSSANRAATPLPISPPRR